MTLFRRIQWHDVIAPVVRAPVRRSIPIIGLVSLVVICFVALPAAAQTEIIPGPSMESPPPGSMGPAAPAGAPETMATGGPDAMSIMGQNEGVAGEGLGGQPGQPPGTQPGMMGSSPSRTVPDLSGSIGTLGQQVAPPLAPVAPVIAPVGPVIAPVAVEDSGPPEWPPLNPQLTAIMAPDAFGIGDPNGFMLLVFVDGEDLDPRVDTPVQFNLATSSGEPVEAPPSHAITVGDIALGDGLVGFDFSDVEANGDIRICVVADGVDGMPCTTVALFDTDVGVESEGVKKKIRNRDTMRNLLYKRYPKIGCRCTGSEIKIDGKKSPDGKLGKFSKNIGGNRLGPYHAGNTQSTLRITSTMKFEAHFTYAIINEPGQGAYSNDVWKIIKEGMSALCTEGQNINRTLTFNAGTKHEVKMNNEKTEVKKNKEEVATEYPYAKTKDASKFSQDGWGYVVQSSSGNPEVTGRLKAYDPPDIVHWIDAPGLNNRPTKVFKRLVPFHQDTFFHAFLHGSPSIPANNCDCYFGLRTGRADAKGAAQSPQILSKVDCSK